MDKQNNKKQYEEIDLRDLCVALWERKIIIICVIIVFSVLGGLFSVFVLTPVYNTDLNIVISIPEKYTTRYGEYKLPITSNEQYVNLIISNDVLINTIKDMNYDSEEITLEKFKKRIGILQFENTNTIQNSFIVTVAADNPEESLRLAQTLYDNYIEFMDVMTKERAVSYYINDFYMEIKFFENELDSQKELLRKNEELLASTPKFIESRHANIEIQTPLDDTSDYVIPINTINPNYIKIENDIVQNKQTIDRIENSIRMNNQYLEHLNIEKQALDKYYETGRSEKLESSVVGVIDTNVYLPSPPVAPSQKSSPNNTLNVAISAVIGGVIGVLGVLMKEYWFLGKNYN